MRSSRLICLFASGLVFLSACTAFNRESATVEPLPSPPATWTAELTQSGGIAAVQLSVEITSDGQLRAENTRSGKSVQKTLPPGTLAQVKELIAALPGSPAAPVASSCADCFNYSLTIASAGHTLQVQADDTTIAASGAQDLISLLRSLRDSALASQP